MARIRRGKSINQITEQLKRLTQQIAGGMDNPRYARVVKSFNKYLDNMKNSKTFKSIEKRDRNNNGGMMSFDGVDKMFSTKISRSTYMGLNNG